jgi:hypothetical protein
LLGNYLRTVDLLLLEASISTAVLRDSLLPSRASLASKVRSTRHIQQHHPFPNQAGSALKPHSQSQSKGVALHPFPIYQPFIILVESTGPASRYSTVQWPVTRPESKYMPKTIVVCSPGGSERYKGTSCPGWIDACHILLQGLANAEQSLPSNRAVRPNTTRCTIAV